ncbi:hypothetical protein [Microcystis phage Mel-JY01]
MKLIKKIQDEVFSPIVLDDVRQFQIAHIGAMYKNGQLLSGIVDDILEYSKSINITIGEDNLKFKYVPVDVDSNLTYFIQNNLYSEFQSGRICSAQEFIDASIDGGDIYDVVLITGIFDKNIYGNSYYDFVKETLNRSYDISREKIIITFDMVKNKELNVVYLFAELFTLFPNVKIEKVNSETLIISIEKK